MDKDLLRIVIIAIGGIVFLGMVLWGVFKSKRPKRSIGFYDEGNPLDNTSSSLVVNTEKDDFDIVPLGSAIDSDQISETGENSSDFVLPKIIQFSIVAETDQKFNGRDLADAFQLVGLQYGSMKVFERLDEKNRVDYAVASMVEPGTFPDADFELYDFPGIVFFLQAGELDKPLIIFDELIETMQLIAGQIKGVILDHNRQPLTEQTIEQFRTNLI
ncbi:MAG: cell division protein FtsZ [Methylococcales symbiont of Hymedesmia sp. n. MRB-2018]|nr:MAG: cell division protein FtsZ [Methylococcales symbiont of Hymedesmia sp. n. MRB-2018]KAF3982715.1 MAG: cell division protein FtsZ [Methylococcales symbiont of Hymedesmia sp. n. MRB-2018]